MFSVLQTFSFTRILGYLAFSAGWLVFANFFGRLIPDQQLWFAFAGDISVWIAYLLCGDLCSDNPNNLSYQSV